MTSDTKWTVGTGIAIVTAVAGSAVAVIAVVVTLTGDVRADLRDVRADLRDVRADLRNVHARMDDLDARLRAVEVALGTACRDAATPPSAGDPRRRVSRLR